jgi:phosphohistidine phosphatase
MKRLILVRHAKSSWKNALLSDVDRPLNARGKRDAPRIGAYLASQGMQPDIILASPAKRARKTAKLIAEVLPDARERILYDPALYQASPELLMARLGALDENWQQVMLIGHNPGLTEFAKLLTNIGIDNLPTCGVIVTDLPITSWGEAISGTGKVILRICPKDLPACS